MEISENEVKRKVKERIGDDCFEELETFFEEHPISIQGTTQPEGFLFNNVMICIYKDVTAMGYSQLSKATRSWHNIGDKTLRLNCQKIRISLAIWGRSKMDIGTADDWNESVKDVVLNEPTKDVNLWIDSTEFALRGSIPKSDPY